MILRPNGQPHREKKPDPRTTYESIEAALKEVIPRFVEACNLSDQVGVLIHQDAFAASLDIDEILLLGMAVKYAGFKGKEVTIINAALNDQYEGKNTVGDGAGSKSA